MANQSNARKAKDDWKAQFRIPADLAAWLKSRAEENCRSINGQLTLYLKEARKREEAGGAHG